jgi:hypothetical protein
MVSFVRSNHVASKSKNFARHSPGLPWCVRLCLAALVVTMVSSAAWGQVVLTRDAGMRFEEAIQPFAPGEWVVAPWKIGDVAVSSGSVRMELVGPDNRATLNFVYRGTGKAPITSTQSFDLVLIGPVKNQHSDALLASVHQIAARLKLTDEGGFYAPPGSKTNQGERHTQPVIPMIWLLLFLLMVVGLSAWRGHAVTTLGADRGKRKAGFGWASFLGLFGFALLLRAQLGPQSFLHENFYGARLLEAMTLGTEPARPMGGYVGIHQLFNGIMPFTMARLFVVTMVFGAIQAPIATWIARLMGVRRVNALLAGLMVASLPLAIRLSASELAFVPATTFLMMAMAAGMVAVRTGCVWWLVCATACVALAGHCRPVTYLGIAPVLGLLVLRPFKSSQPTLDWRHGVGMLLLLAIFSIDDIGPILGSLGEGTALSPGWWQGTRLHDWPLFDMEITPVFLAPLAALSVVFVWVRGDQQKRRLLTALLFYLAVISFFLSSRNGWPASLRYALPYAWVLPIVVVMGIDMLGAELWRTVSWWIAVAAVAVSTLVYAPWTGRHYAQQQEVLFQTQHVQAELKRHSNAIILTPWPRLDRVGGSFLVTQAMALGHRIAPLDELDRLRANGARSLLLYYRGLTCWAHSASGGKAQYDSRGFNRHCADFESRLILKPLVTLPLRPDTDTDWIQLGDELTPLTLGLYRIETMATLKP